MVRGQPNRFIVGHAARVKRSSIVYGIVIVDDVACVTVPLSKEKFAIINAADLDIIRPFKWHAEESEHTFYARNSEGVSMHRLLLGFPTLEIDHENRNGLDNRRLNIRDATTSQNRANSRLMANNTSGFRGIWFDKTMGLWMSEIGGKSNRKRLGYSTTPEDAARLYDQEAVAMYGEFAVLNFPPTLSGILL